MFRVLMRDNVKARIMLSSGEYIHERRNADTPFNSQEYFYEEAYRRLEDKSSRQEQLRINRTKGSTKKTAKKTAPKAAENKQKAGTSAKRGRKKKAE